MKRTPEQNSRLHLLIGELMIDAEHKRELVEEASYGRVSSSKDLTQVECNRLLNHLQTLLNEHRQGGDAGQKMRRKIMSMVHELGWENPSGSIDYNRLNAWLLKFGYLHKELNSYTVQELPALVTQMDKMLAGKYK
jgi:hypothetical protein